MLIGVGSRESHSQINTSVQCPFLFVDLQYRVTLDSLRQISRSFFSGTQERKIQRNITVQESECTRHSFYMLASKSCITAALFQVERLVGMAV